MTTKRDGGEKRADGRPLRGQEAAARLQMWPCCQSVRLTVQDVSQALGSEQLLQTGHFVLQVTHQLVVGILVDDGVALDVLGSVSVARKKKGSGIGVLCVSPRRKGKRLAERSSKEGFTGAC